jgi:hypothetical protein
VPATPANTITPRRAIKNYQVRDLINLRYVALTPRGLSFNEDKTQIVHLAEDGFERPPTCPTASARNCCGWP